MKVLEVNGRCPSLSQLLEDAQTEDILLVRDGRPLARLERFDEEDWQDFQYESSVEALLRCPIGCSIPLGRAPARALRRSVAPG